MDRVSDVGRIRDIGQLQISKNLDGSIVGMQRRFGVFLVKTRISIVPVNRVFSMNTYTRGVSEVSERARERSVALRSE